MQKFGLLLICSAVPSGRQRVASAAHHAPCFPPLPSIEYPAIFSANATKFFFIFSPLALYIFCVCSRFGWWAKGKWRLQQTAAWGKWQAAGGSGQTALSCRWAIDNYQVVIKRPHSPLPTTRNPPPLSCCAATLQIYVCLACALDWVSVCVGLCVCVCVCCA